MAEYSERATKEAKALARFTKDMQAIEDYIASEAWV